MRFIHATRTAGALLLLAATLQSAAQAPAGEVKGQAVRHTAESAVGVVQQARVVLPAVVTGGAVYTGLWKDAPREAKARVPVSGRPGWRRVASRAWRRTRSRCRTA